MSSKNPQFFIIPDAFNPMECKAIINIAESSGFEESLVRMYGKLEKRNDIRNNLRTHFTNEHLALIFTERAQDLLPRVIDSSKYCWFDDDFRVYKYLKGQRFKQHKDGKTVKGELETKFTCLLYLNTIPQNEGGETLFFNSERIDGKRDIIHRIHPVEGTAVLFEHEWWHEGLPVIGETPKYVLRSDALYSTKK